jgi:hypothetical protein
MVVHPKPRFDPRHASGAMQIEQCDVPADMTLRQWRAAEKADRRAVRDAERGLARRVRRALKRR